MKKFKYRNILYKIKYIIPNNVLITRTTITLLYFFHLKCYLNTIHFKAHMFNIFGNNDHSISILLKPNKQKKGARQKKKIE